MKVVGTRAMALVALLATAAWHMPQDPAQAPADAALQRTGTTFVAVDVFVDAGTNALAAWQAELRFADSKLVGIEGGAVQAFAEPPRYDPAALQGGRVVLAALAAGGAEGGPEGGADAGLPSGRVRVARLHLLAPAKGPGEPTVDGVVAADADGERIEVDVEVRRKEGK